MANIYLGDNKLRLQLHLGDTSYHLNVYHSSPHIKLLDNNNYILMDKNGLYLIPKEEDEQ